MTTPQEVAVWIRIGGGVVSAAFLVSLFVREYRERRQREEELARARAELDASLDRLVWQVTERRGTHPRRRLRVIQGGRNDA